MPLPRWTWPNALGINFQLNEADVLDTYSALVPQESLSPVMRLKTGFSLE